MNTIERKEAENMFFAAGNLVNFEDQQMLDNANVKFLGTSGAGRSFRVEQTEGKR
jgi:hypothetical protein